MHSSSWHKSRCFGVILHRVNLAEGTGQWTIGTDWAEEPSKGNDGLSKINFNIKRYNCEFMLTLAGGIGGLQKILLQAILLS
ncbi:hypothetical protein CEXT_512391 [Caerostris extrusa]|uniref:Uncharacterized protein n=1 Tax=Caerostris extrusa TaxID=172846 RepID=A0AAV4XY75_CAEEX|nr:hypothetical protein CEXT_512391 [Caerostris extrusa]